MKWWNLLFHKKELWKYKWMMTVWIYLLTLNKQQLLLKFRNYVDLCKFTLIQSWSESLLMPIIEYNQLRKIKIHLILSSYGGNDASWRSYGSLKTKECQNINLWIKIWKDMSNNNEWWINKTRLIIMEKIIK